MCTKIPHDFFSYSTAVLCIRTPGLNVCVVITGEMSDDDGVTFYSMSEEACHSQSRAHSGRRSSERRQSLPLTAVEEHYSCGDVYRGTVYVQPNGSKVKEGRGRYRFANGSFYDGEWKNGQMEGRGTFEEATTGDRFDGIWAQGKRVCGVYGFANGDLFIGSFDRGVGNMKHGRCVVVDDMIPYDAIYNMDILVHKAPFNTDPDLLLSAASRATSGRRNSVPRPNELGDDDLQRCAPARDGIGWVSRDVPQDVSRAQKAQSRPTPNDRLEAAKQILRSRRDELETHAKNQRRESIFAASTSGRQQPLRAPEVPAQASKTKRFAAVQSGTVERFAHVPTADVSEAFRFHYR